MSTLILMGIRIVDDVEANLLLLKHLIALVGRIAAVADVFDALASSRPYKPTWEIDRAVGLLARRACAHRSTLHAAGKAYTARCRLSRQHLACNQRWAAKQV